MIYPAKSGFSHSYLLKILLSCFSFTLSNLISAQQYNFHTYSVEEGLAQSQVLALCKDTRGNIWFGTYNGGISIFNGIDFNHLTTEEGLVNNTVQVIMEDSRGNIWIGTDGGLSIHDGYGFKNFLVGMGISSSKIQCAAEDTSGKIWIGTKTGGINIFNNETIEVIIAEDGLPNNNVKALYLDKSGRVWASCYGMGIAIFEGRNSLGDGKSDPWQISYFSTANGLLDDEVNCFYQDKNGTMWIGSEKGITVITDISNLGKSNPEYKMTGHPVTSFFEDDQRNFWIGTRGEGILRNSSTQSPKGSLIDLADGFTNIQEANGLNNNYVLRITGDNAGGVWVGTDGGGASHYNGDAFLSFNQNNGLAGNMVMSVMEDGQGKIWIGTFGNGITRFDPENNSFSSDFSKVGFNGKYVYAITRDIKGNIWFGTHHDGVYKYDGSNFRQFTAQDGMKISEIYSVFQDKMENIWIGGTGGVAIFSGNAFGAFGNEAGLNKDKVYSITDDKFGNIWFATDHGIVKKTANSSGSEKNTTIIFKEKTNGLKPRVGGGGSKIITYTERDGLISNMASSIIKDNDGNIWIGTEKGISFFNGDKFINFNAKNGLTSDNIYSIIFDETGNLLAGTEKGIDKITFSEDKKIQRVTNYSSEEGLKGIECNINAVNKDARGNFWFGTIKGLTRYNPHRELLMDHLPLTYITDISLFFQKTNWKEFSDSLTRWYNFPVNLKLPYDKNHLTFQFAATPAKGGSEKALFRFMLEGFDKTWFPASAKREATYSNLAPGYYVFKVKTYFGDIESPETSFSFTISPPYWNTWWFYFSGTLVFLFCGYVILSLRTRTLQRTKDRLELMVRVRTQEILRQKEELENVSIVARETVQGVLIANKDGRVEWMNDGLQRMTGYSFDEIKIKFGEMLYQISSYQEINNVLQKVKETKQSTQYDSMHLTKAGIEQWVTGTVTPVFEYGELKKIVIIYSDITERKKFEHEINQKNNDITESILYAKQIQEAVLPKKEKLYNIKPESFILDLPKDIVSGDFYWFTIRENILFLAAADCTGHGVPGALMCMIGNEFLYQVTYQMNIREPDLILSELDKKIKQSLRQVGDEKEAKDGMDIAFCTLNLETNLMKYAGAYRPLIVIRRNGDFVQLEPDKESIGGFMKNEKDFKSQSIQLQKGDSIYLFTDGYLDQFGGTNEKKFFNKRFKDLLLKIYLLPMEEQKSALENSLHQWKGANKQTDDVLVMGVKI